MIRIGVIVDPTTAHEGMIDELKNNLPELTAKLAQTLEDASGAETENLIIPAMTLAEKNSDNFHVIGTILRNINMYLHTHEYPRTVTIVCKDDPTATMYRQVYNFYIADTKATRLQDQNWD